jgi:hypothetical protein
MLYTIVVIVCSGLPCNEDTSVALMIVPEKAKSPIECMFGGQEYAAQSNVVRDTDWIIVRCRPLDGTPS